MPRGHSRYPSREQGLLILGFVATVAISGASADLAEFDPCPSAEWVELLSDTLRPYALWIGMGTILDRSFRPHAHVLKDGSKLLLDHETPEGVYDLLDGRRLHVSRPLDAPARVAFRDRPVRVLPFVLQTSRRAGLVVQAIGDAAWRADSTLLREYLESPLPWLGANDGVRKATGARHSKISPDWCKNGHVPMPDTTNGLARIVWLTFNAGSGETSPALRAAARRLALHDTGAVLAARRPDPPTKAEALRGQVVGSVVVDLGSGRVIERRGRVR